MFVERLWHHRNYERVYLPISDGVSAARADIVQFMDWYNNERPHSSLSDETHSRPILHCCGIEGSGLEEWKTLVRPVAHRGAFVASDARRRGFFTSSTRRSLFISWVKLFPDQRSHL